MFDDFSSWALVAGLIAVSLSIISGARLVQRIKQKRKASAIAFSIRFLFSAAVAYVFLRIAISS